MNWNQLCCISRGVVWTEESDGVLRLRYRLNLFRLRFFLFLGMVYGAIALLLWGGRKPSDLPIWLVFVWGILYVASAMNIRWVFGSFLRQILRQGSLAGLVR